MIITFDTATNTLDISHTGNHSWGTDVVAALNRHGQTVSLRGVTIKADGETVLDASWPPPGVKFSKTNQDTLATARVNWQPEQTITVDAWCITTEGKTLTASDTFTAPRPPQPYPSWMWDNGWQPTVPYPDEGEWRWDEEAQAWVEPSILEKTPSAI